LLVQTFAQFIILWDDAAMTRMRFERFEASMKLSLPGPVNSPVPELSLHELGAHCIVIHLVIKEGRKIVWSTAKISCATSDAVIDVSDRVNLLLNCMGPLVVTIWHLVPGSQVGSGGR
jgi:hypothetical protein